jgi:hypothetical protein
MIILRIAIIVLGVGFLLPGLAGVFRVERFAEVVALTPESQTGIEAIRVLIGAPYLAMSAVTIYAAVRSQWAWLAPIAAIEGAMALTRLFSGLTDGFGTNTFASFAQLIIEMVVCVVLSLGAILPARLSR